MTEVDPYDYPFPCKTQTMYLQTINQRDTGFQKIKIINPDSFALKTNDISGANSILPGYRFQQKESFINKTNDIDGCFPKKLIRENISRTGFNLKNDDIKGSKPQINKFIATRHCNPLVPEYKLPSAQIKVSTPPKFIRDSINITDIEGTRPNPYNMYKFKITNAYEEIEGSKPKKLFIPKDQINILDVRDINEYLQFKTSRITNPLNPVYVATDENGKKIEIGEIEFSKSRQLHPIASKRDGSLDLRTKDIDGAWADTHSEKFLKRKERKHYIQTLHVKDIPGAQVSTLRKGMSTNRKLNPIWPFDSYPYLGEKEEKIGITTGFNIGTNNKKNRVLESKSAIILEENVTKMIENLTPLPLNAVEDRKKISGGNKESIQTAVMKTAIEDNNQITIISNETNKRKGSDLHQTKSRKSSGANIQQAINLENQKIPIVSGQSEQSQNMNQSAKAKTIGEDGELKFYSGMKEQTQNNFKTKLTTAQNFDKFIKK